MERTPNVDYDVDHWHGALFMTRRTEDKPNSEVVIAPLARPAEARELLPHRQDVKLEDTCVKDGHFVVMERSAEKGLQECRVFALPESHDFEEARPPAFFLCVCHA